MVTSSPGEIEFIHRCHAKRTLIKVKHGESLLEFGVNTAEHDL
jgi:hypothetical protein